jgi:hypothetical protein
LNPTPYIKIYFVNGMNGSMRMMHNLCFEGCSRKEGRKEGLQKKEACNTFVLVAVRTLCFVGAPFFG